MVSVGLTWDDLADIDGMSAGEKERLRVDRGGCSFMYRNDSPMDLQLDQAGRIVGVSIPSVTVWGVVEAPDGSMQVLKPLPFGPALSEDVPPAKGKRQQIGKQ
jgi:hypothetical protein